MSETTSILSPDKEIKILKWIVHKGSQISSGSILCLYKVPEDEKVQRLKSNTNCGLVKKLLHKEGATVAKKTALLEIAECTHTTIIKDLCADCGADLQQIDMSSSSKASVPMIHSVPELKVSEELAKKLGRADTDRLLLDRKLVLLVDLDQTLIHTTNDNVPNNLKDVYHFQLHGTNSPWYHTRLRPGTLNFLKNIDPIYELHICTFGARNYAHMICAFLDENGRLFSNRILSRDECLNATSKKDNLKALFPDDCGDAMVCIIDDREDVWNHATNLIQVKPYHFFQHTGDINAPEGLAKRELDGKGVDFNKIVKLQKVKSTKKPAPESSKKESKITKETSETEEIKVDKEQVETTNSDLEKNPESTPVSGENTEESTKSEEIKEESAAIVEVKEDSLKIVEELKLEITVSVDKVKEESAAPVEVTKKESPETVAEIKVDSSDTAEEIKVDSSGTVEEIVFALPAPVAEKDDDNLVEIQDPDDYLLYLESILKLIHERFYEIYDRTKEIPDLKNLVPKLKSEILVGVSIVFSGLVPSIVKLEHSRPYAIAKNLGAEVTEGFTEKTTHLVAASTGTQKVFQAQKNKSIQVVTPDWLWTSAERWERVDEKLFPLSTNRPQKMRQIPAHCSPDRIPEPNDVKFNNPYLQMSDNDIASMEAEVDDSSESEEEPSPPEAERPSRKRKADELNDDVTAEKQPTVDFSGIDEDGASVSSESGKSGRSSSDEEEEESPSAKFRRGEEISSEFEIDSNDSVDSVEDPGSEEDDGEWNMMGAALEREFLGSND